MIQNRDFCPAFLHHAAALSRRSWDAFPPFPFPDCFKHRYPPTHQATTLLQKTAANLSGPGTWSMSSPVVRCSSSFILTPAILAPISKIHLARRSEFVLCQLSHTSQASRAHIAGGFRLFPCSAARSSHDAAHIPCDLYTPMTLAVQQAVQATVAPTHNRVRLAALMKPLHARDRSAPLRLRSPG